MGAALRQRLDVIDSVGVTTTHPAARKHRETGFELFHGERQNHRLSLKCSPTTLRLPLFLTVVISPTLLGGSYEVRVRSDPIPMQLGESFPVGFTVFALACSKIVTIVFRPLSADGPTTFRVRFPPCPL
jgi:hypothetical protein